MLCGVSSVYSVKSSYFMVFLRSAEIAWPHDGRDLRGAVVGTDYVPRGLTALRVGPPGCRPHRAALRCGSCSAQRSARAGSPA